MKKLLNLGVSLGLAALCYCGGGCTSNDIKTTSAINGATVGAVDTALQVFSEYSLAHPVNSNTVAAISNAYNVYYNAELTLSNLSMVYVSLPNTNTAALITAEGTAIGQSATNLINIINSIIK